MRQGYDLTTKQSQKMSLSSHLIQAIGILQLNNQELSEYIEKELLENPLLEYDEEYLRNTEGEDLPQVSSYDREIFYAEGEEFISLTDQMIDRGRHSRMSDMINYVRPDFRIENTNGRVKAIQIKKSFPKLCIGSYYEELKEQRKEDKELDEYLEQKKSSALWLIKSINEREKNLTNITNAIVDFQSEFFLKGEKYLKALTLKQIAEIVGVHESTVSRAVNGKYILTDKGLFELKYFFNYGIMSTKGEVSSTAIRFMIKEIIKNEGNYMYPDDHIANLLYEDEGIYISRRTVAKYRKELGIETSAKRKRKKAE